MTDTTDISSLAPPRPARRSADWGGKALLVCALAVLMTIPGMFVWALIKDRAVRSDGAIAEVSQMQGGSQQVMGPLLIAPYAITPLTAGGEIITGWYVVSPESGSAVVKVETQIRRRGIFDVPVYTAVADINARFAAPPAAPNLPPRAVVDWTRARIVMGFSDLRGGKLDPVATITSAAGRSQVAFAPASGINLGAAATPPIPEDRQYRSAPEAGGRFGLVSTPAAPILAGGVLQTRLKFSGAQRLAVMPFAKATSIRIAGDWPSPSFNGGFLPTRSTVTDDGFTANWDVPFMARGLVDQGSAEALSLSDLGQRDLGVTFMRTNNPYQNVMRALKYAVMFVGLVFLTFFVFEALSGRRLHPAQYVLIGLAQMIFYLLLLSLSEYVGFDIGFAIAAVATVLLIGLYAGAAFRARRYRIQAMVIFTTVYGLIYLLMRLEDFALLAGSIAAFVGLTAAMWLTRNIDWYGGRAIIAPADTPSAT
jgi:inner membrane protein